MKRGRKRKKDKGERKREDGKQREEEDNKFDSNKNFVEFTIQVVQMCV